MARLNIEDCWWSDPRRMKLVLKVGFLADAYAVNAWRLAQEFWGKNRGLIPREVFMSLQGADLLLEVGLAEDKGSSVYVRGSSSYLDWLVEKREQAKEAGKKSAQRPRDPQGRLLPKEAKTTENIQRESNEGPAESSEVQPSGSYSYSYSSSSSSESEEAGKKASRVFAKRSIENFEASFDPEGQRIREIFTALGMKDMNSRIASVLKIWGTADDFRTFLTTLKTSSTYQGLKSEPEKRRYISGVIRKEIAQSEEVQGVR